MTTQNANVNNAEVNNETVIEEQSFYQRHEGKIKIALAVCTIIGTGLYAWNKLKPSDESETSDDSSETTESNNEPDLQEIA